MDIPQEDLDIIRDLHHRGLYLDAYAHAQPLGDALAWNWVRRTHHGRTTIHPYWQRQTIPLFDSKHLSQQPHKSASRPALRLLPAVLRSRLDQATAMD